VSNYSGDVAIRFSPFSSLLSILSSVALSCYLLPPFHNTCRRFDFSRYIPFAMYLDINIYLGAYQKECI
jgi:hypothetical protein